MMRRGTLVIALAAAALLVTACTWVIDRLDPSAVAVMNQPPYEQGQWAISVLDLETGEKLVALNDQDQAAPVDMRPQVAPGRCAARCRRSPPAARRPSPSPARAPVR